MATDQECREAIIRWKSTLLAIPGVTALGIGVRIKGEKIKRPFEPCITVCVVKKRLMSADDPQWIPKIIDGIPTDVVETGEIGVIGEN
jgi:hypothetical protein